MGLVHVGITGDLFICMFKFVQIKSASDDRNSIHLIFNCINTLHVYHYTYRHGMVSLNFSFDHKVFINRRYAFSFFLREKKKKQGPKACCNNAVIDTVDRICQLKVKHH